MTDNKELQPDLFASMAARDEGMERVLHDDFAAAYRDAVRRLCVPGEYYTGEDIRVLLTKAGVRPHHHNGWGAAANAAIKAGLIVPTGALAPMELPKSHARKTPVYLRRGSIS